MLWNSGAADDPGEPSAEVAPAPPLGEACGQWRAGGDRGACRRGQPASHAISHGHPETLPQSAARPLEQHHPRQGSTGPGSRTCEVIVCGSPGLGARLCPLCEEREIDQEQARG